MINHYGFVCVCVCVCVCVFCYYAVYHYSYWDLLNKIMQTNNNVWPELSIDVDT